MNYIDMHCDTLVKAVEQKKETAKKLEHTMVDAERLHRCGTKAQFFAMFLQQKKENHGQPVFPGCPWSFQYSYASSTALAMSVL